MINIRIVGPVALAISAALLVSCGQRSASPSTTLTPTTPSVAATAPATTTPATTTTTLPTPAQPPTRTPSTPAASVLRDGRYPAYLIGVGPQARTVTFDVVQYLSGARADEAYRRAHPGGDPSAPDGFFILNTNPLLRTLPVRADAPVGVLLPPLSGTTTTMITRAELPGYLASKPGEWGQHHLWPNPFWLTVRSHVVVSLQEQYLP
jgi:hypothetical protein